MMHEAIDAHYFLTTASLFQTAVRPPPSHRRHRSWGVLKILFHLRNSCVTVKATKKPTPPVQRTLQCLQFDPSPRLPELWEISNHVKTMIYLFFCESMVELRLPTLHIWLRLVIVFPVLPSLYMYIFLLIPFYLHYDLLLLTMWLPF